MDVQQLFTLLASERQKQTEDLKAVLQSNQDLWRASQAETGRRHAELVQAMGDQTRTLAQLFQGTGGTGTGSTSPMGALVGPSLISNMQVCKMGPNDAPDDFLVAFERMAVAAGWPEQQWATRLIPCLAGTALTAYQTLSPELANNYRAIKNHILDYLGFTREHYRQEFRGAHMGDKERPKALLHRLRKLAERWLQPCLGDAQALLAEILHEQFLEAVPKNLKSWIQRQGSRSLAQVIDLAEAYLDSQTTTLPVGDRQGNGWHNRGQATPARSHSGHQERVPQRGRKVPDPMGGCKKTMISPIGGKSGPQQSRGERQVNLLGDQFPLNHTHEGYRVTVQVEGQPVVAFLDSGASQSMIKTQVWDTIQIGKEGVSLEGPKVSIRCIHGDIHEYETHWTRVQFGAREDSLLVAVVPGAPYDMILGRDWEGWSGVWNTEQVLVNTRAQCQKEGTPEEDLGQTFPFLGEIFQEGTSRGPRPSKAQLKRQKWQRRQALAHTAHQREVPSIPDRVIQTFTTFQAEQKALRDGRTGVPSCQMGHAEFRTLFGWTGVHISD
uniref:Uncharacterized protein LOC117360304 n=1 Tax=Geotrypetes seraphini TaxID=260995 RepID=A0A6P8QVL7_GEOSA|nr:uncharacterized protein LOC117360304 [Geotrypetes seraphini]